MKLRVLMIPSLSRFDNEESGIKRVVEAYHYYTKMSIDYVECGVGDTESYDVFAVHAGTTNVFPTNKPIVAHCHGLYWTSDYTATAWEWKANANVIESIRRADVVTVPSEWVATNIARDVRITPVVIPHGIEWEDWEHSFASEGYVLWNKNRDADVCNPRALGELARRVPDVNFVTTFGPHGIEHSRIKVIGLQTHNVMKEIICKAGVYLSSTKETFGIGVLEALAAGVPVLGFDHGGNSALVKHCENGFLAKPNDYNELAAGLRYCLQYRDVLSHNARLSARAWNWVEPAQKVVDTYRMAYDIWKAKQRPFTI